MTAEDILKGDEIHWALLMIFPFHILPLPRHTVEAKMIQTPDRFGPVFACKSIYSIFFIIMLMKSLT